METLTADKIPVRSTHLAYQMVEGEAVVLDIPSRILRGLNPVGSRIYQLIDGKRTLGEIVKAIQEEFACEEQKVFEDVKTFLEHLLEKKMIAFY